MTDILAVTGNLALAARSGKLLPLSPSEAKLCSIWAFYMKKPAPDETIPAVLI
jgi:hypothetical protein